jgi:hypothetical protein
LVIGGWSFIGHSGLVIGALGKIIPQNLRDFSLQPLEIGNFCGTLCGQSEPGKAILKIEIAGL